MKKLVTILALTLATHSFSQSQMGINQEAADRFTVAKTELNEVYNQILTEYSSDSIFVESLKRSQWSWEIFRDAQLEMRYPNYGPGYYGSSHVMCLSLYKAKLTKERTEQLKAWIVGIQEGDICKGSMKFKQ
ncbi:MAG: DUF1311 domain-containing protein [Crocinitomicaceae bacterium]|nr:DUF1311 domain-containing protein [Crocinitomicaceae bacterium]